MNLPNKLTIARMCMVPLFMIALMFNTDSSRILATVIFALASLTDMLDGQIARKYNMVTNFGKLMDPLADKVLTAAAMICLVELGDLAAWIAIVIIFRENLITGLRAVAASENIVVAANIWGNVKTVCQMFALMFLMLKPQIVALCGVNIGLWLMYAAVILTVYSGLDYVLKINKQITWN